MTTRRGFIGKLAAGMAAMAGLLGIQREPKCAACGGPAKSLMDFRTGSKPGQDCGVWCDNAGCDLYRWGIDNSLARHADLAAGIPRQGDGRAFCDAWKARVVSSRRTA